MNGFSPAMASLCSELAEASLSQSEDAYCFAMTRVRVVGIALFGSFDNLKETHLLFDLFTYECKEMNSALLYIA